MKTFFSVLAVITLVAMMVGAVLYFATGVFYKSFSMTPVFFIIFAAASKSKRFQK